MLYLIQVYGEDYSLLKIGFSDNLEYRLNQYLDYNPLTKILKTREGGRDLESYFHFHFSKYKYPGEREWFYYSREIVDKFDKIELPSKDEMIIEFILTKPSFDDRLGLFNKFLKKNPDKSNLIPEEYRKHLELNSISHRKEVIDRKLERTKLEISSFNRVRSEWSQEEFEKYREKVKLWIKSNRPREDYISFTEDGDLVLNELMLSSDIRSLELYNKKIHKNEESVLSVPQTAEKVEENALSDKELLSKIVDYFKVENVYTRKEIKEVFNSFLNDLGYKKVILKANDIDHFFNTKQARTVDPVSNKPCIGFKILSIKEN